MKINIKPLRILYHAKLTTLLVGGFIGMTIFEIAADDVATGDHNIIAMGIGVIVTLLCFSSWGIMLKEDEKACEKDEKAV